MAGSRLFVGNLAFEVRDDELKELFARAGTCKSAALVMDRATGRPRGFAFVEMGSEEEARRAVAELHGTQLRGRAINVSEARERSAGGGERPSSTGPSFRRFGPDAPPSDRAFQKSGKSRRGLRGRKRSL